MSGQEPRPPARTTRALLELGVLSHLDYELGEALCGLVDERRPEVALGVALASRAVQRGHVFLELAALGSQGFQDESGQPITAVALPPLRDWCEALSRSRLVAVEPQSAQSPRPLVLVGSRLYLARYFEYERRLAAMLLARSVARHDGLDGALLRRGLDRLFPLANEALLGQRRACLLAALGGLSVISGGPGTGKTFTVAKVLLLLQEQALERGSEPLRVALLAPTGKAAQRLGEAIAQNLDGAPDALAPHLPREASTIHRALGFQRHAPTRFRHHADNPLPADVVVVDEASMVDLALMTKLVGAVSPDARLVLLGDKDQLASVEAGAILGDVYGGNPGDGYSRAFAARARSLSGDELPVSRARPEPGIHDCMVHLTHVHRFAGGGPIARLASAVNRGSVEDALAVLGEGDPAVELFPMDHAATLEASFGRLVEQRFAGLSAPSVEHKLAVLSSFRFLCAHRRGPFGVEALNRFVAEQLRRAGVLPGSGDWYDGRPVLVTANDYGLELFNGDVGVIAADEAREPSDGELRPLVAFFPGARSSVPRRFSPGQLPPHETVFAMSVHKAQGSELTEVALVLPERISPIVTRELLYTAITRARERVRIYATRELLAQAIEQTVQRASGLGEALWGRRGG